MTLAAFVVTTLLVVAVRTDYFVTHFYADSGPIGSKLTNAQFSRYVRTFDSVRKPTNQDKSLCVAPSKTAGKVMVIMALVIFTSVVLVSNGT